MDLIAGIVEKGTVLRNGRVDMTSSKQATSFTVVLSCMSGAMISFVGVLGAASRFNLILLLLQVFLLY